MNLRVTVRAVIMRDKKLLCVRQKDYETGTLREFWSTPGGKLDPGEALTDGLRREMLEETGIEPDIGSLLYVQQFTKDGVESLEFFFHVHGAEHYIDVDLSKTTHGEAEIEAIDFIDPASSHSLPILPKFLITEPLHETIAAGGPTKIISHEA